MNLDNTYTRTVDAPDSVSAQNFVKSFAQSEGYRVKTVRSVRLVSEPRPSAPTARYRVELAVGRGL